MTISQRIFAIMKEKGISQAKLSSATGLSPAAISDWKTKNTNPSADKLSAIADCLGVSVCYLVGKSDSVLCTSESRILTVESQDFFNNADVTNAYLNLSTEDKLEIQLEIMKRSKK